jgi:hypothetical protein
MRIHQGNHTRRAGRIRAAVDLVLSCYGAYAVATAGFPAEAAGMPTNVAALPGVG